MQAKDGVTIFLKGVKKLNNYIKYLLINYL
jgi:hypothetical protein